MRPEDVKYVTGCDASHPDRRGGQHVAKTCSGVLAIHTPTGLGVMCDSERSMQGNKLRALRLLQQIVDSETTDLGVSFE